MPEITQKLGFDASQAVNAIKSMDSALKGLNTRLREFNKVTSASSGSAKIASGMDNVAKKAASAQASVQKTTQSVQKFGSKGSAAVQKVTFAFSGLAKALVARTAVQAITRLTGAISESAEAAAEFEISIARISNIAQGPGSSIAELTDNLSALAVELGRPQTEVAAAAFEALQNDLGSTQETMVLLAGAANDLALVTGGTLTQAVNSLSSVIKAYDLEASEATTISDQFFAAIDKGRITLEELENSLGKITPLAARLDIGFNEVAAAMAAITQSGTSASVANTQLRSVFQKLIKPTEELQGAFEKLGADTFQQLIAQTGGLQQALTAIAGAFDNDERAIAGAFGRLRGQLGVFNLLANEGKIFTSTLEAVNNSAGRAADAADRIDGTNARKSQKAWAAFDETMRQVGNTVLEMQTNFITAFNTIIPNGESAVFIIKAIAAAATAAAAAATGIYVLNTALVALGASATVALGPFALIAVAAAGLGVAINQALTSTADVLDDLDKKQQEGLKQIEENTSKALEQNNKNVQELLNSRGEIVDKYLEGLSDAFDKETQVLRDASDRAGKALGFALEDFEAGIGAVFDRIKKGLADAGKGLQKAINKQNTAKQKLEDFQFDRDQKGLSNVAKFNNALGRANKEAQKLEGLLKKAKTDPKAAKAAEASMKRLGDLTERVATAAAKTQAGGQRKFAERKAEELQEKALKAEVELSGNEVTRLTTLQKELAAEQQRLHTNEAITAQIIEQTAELAKLVSTTTKAGELKGPEQAASDAKAAAELRKKTSGLFSQLSGDFFAKFGEAENVEALTKALSDSFNQAQFKFDNVRAALQTKLDEAPFKASIEVVQAQGGFGDAGLDARVAGAVEGAGANPVARAEALRQETAKITLEQLNLQTQIAQTEARFEKFSENVWNSAREAIQISGDSSLQVMTGLEGSLANLQESMLDPNITQEKLDTIENQITAWQGRVAGAINPLEGQEATITEDVAEAFTQVGREMESQFEQLQNKVNFEKLFNPDALKIGLDSLSSQIGGVADKTEGIKTGFDEAKVSAGQVATATGGIVSTASAATSAVNGLARAYANAAAQASKLPAASGGGALYHGGKVNYRAAGGPITRGQDTQLVAAQPGEMFINARNTGKFFSQLQAMNAGQSPQYRDKGGPVTNIGDINVSVTSDSNASSPQVGRSIASDLRRELRRQTSTL